MSRKQLNLEDSIMNKIENGEVRMRSRLYFIMGSIATFMSLVCAIIFGVFLSNLTFFYFRPHGRMRQLRLEYMLVNFPWWIIFLGIISIVVGVFLLKRYEVSYKKNFAVILLALTASIVTSGYVIDHFGISDLWSYKRPMHLFYQQLRLENTTDEDYFPSRKRPRSPNRHLDN